ncbi:MAG: ATP-binding cassette domain-containing protein [Solirubrobacterales bacterium]|nr:ATP-binding cassette domain-containing protein [Solirubrobacterales bacterium]
MSLLELDRVEKSFSSAPRDPGVLRGASLEVEAGELIAVWGLRRSGRSTFLRVAGGIEAPDAGAVRFEGRDLREPGHDVLGGGIGYCRRSFRPSEGPHVIDHLAIGQVARGASLKRALELGHAALERVEAGSCAARRPAELDPAESIRVAIARTIVLRPRVLLIDEPTIGVDLLVRDSLLALLLSLAKDGIAIVTTTGDSTCLSGARALTLSEGELRGTPAPELAPVVPLRRQA